MVIYATELLLWLGVFACGGYFNLIPWIRRHRERTQSPASLELPQVDRGLGTSNDMELRQVGSSTSVFRTPSSVVE